MALSPETLRLYLVTDPNLCADRGVVETVRLAVQGGVTCVQLRDKYATTAETVALARALKTVLDGTGIPLIINDNVDAALEADTDGVHVGQSDKSAREARDRLSPGKLIGLSCESEDHVRAVDTRHVDYLGVGPVFGTPTKRDHSEPIGMAGLAALCSLSKLPTVAIGGLKARHQEEVLRAGCDGLAVVSAICGRPDPEAAARAFNAQEFGTQP